VCVQSLGASSHGASTALSVPGDLLGASSDFALAMEVASAPLIVAASRSVWPVCDVGVLPLLWCSDLV